MHTLTGNNGHLFYRTYSYNRCRACKSFKKKECCSIDFDMCREVMPEKKIDQCFSKCTYDNDCNGVISPNPDELCLFDGGCSRSKSKGKENYDSYQKSQKYYTSKMEIEYVQNQKHGQDKYADGKGRRMLGSDTDYYPPNERKAKTKEKGVSKSDTSRTVRRRRLHSNDIPA